MQSVIDALVMRAGGEPASSPAETAKKALSIVRQSLQGGATATSAWLQSRLDLDADSVRTQLRSSREPMTPTAAIEMALVNGDESSAFHRELAASTDKRRNVASKLAGLLNEACDGRDVVKRSCFDDFLRRLAPYATIVEDEAPIYDFSMKKTH